MMVRRLTSASSLESLKREAKRWLKQLCAGDGEARGRFESVHPRPPTAPTLRDVQLALAREHGFAGWTELARAVVEIESRRAPADEAAGAASRLPTRPEALSTDRSWLWSTGAGTDVYDMFVACATGDVEAVRRLLDADPSLVRAHYEYHTPLGFAVRADQREIAALLLDRGADPIALGNVVEDARERGFAEMVELLEARIAERHGASDRGEPVASAIRAGDLPLVERLLDGRAELVQAGDRRSNQPIHWAVMTRQLHMIDVVLARGADIDAERQDGARPIHLANGDYHFRGWRDVASHGRPEPDDVYRHLVSRGATVDIWMAAAKGDVERVRTILDADPGAVNQLSPYNSYYIGCGSAIRNAAAGGHLEVVKLLLDRGADPNLPEEGIAPRGHALYSAVYHRHHEIAELLLAHGANPDAPVESSADAVWIAIRNGDVRMLRQLAAHGARWVFPYGSKGGLSYARAVASGIERSMVVLAAYGDTKTAREMLEADPDLADDPEALEEAAGRGRLGFVRLLLRHRPDVARRVTVAKPAKAARLLFEHGMDANRPNWLGVTPLHRFAEQGDVTSARLFIDHGARLDARDQVLQSTPLGYAARAGKLGMVRLLLDRGAPARHAEDPTWATPRAWAQRRGHARVAKLLEKRGAT